MVTSCLRLMVTRRMNTVLAEEFSRDKVHSAVFDIGPLKAPRRDGLPSLPKVLTHCGEKGDEGILGYTQ